jgi:molybdenum cofactor guanylyltransferase
MAMVAAVLAGGASRRMGEPKAGLVVEGRTLLERAVAAAREAGLRPVVVAKATSPLPPVDAERWTEPDLPRHPLAGIVAALKTAGPAGIVALACDTPFVPARLLAELAGRDATTLVRAGGRLHPLPGRYAAQALAPLAAALADEAPLQRALLALGAAVLDEADEAALANVNTPEDLVRARARAAGG